MVLALGDFRVELLVGLTIPDVVADEIAEVA